MDHSKGTSKLQNFLYQNWSSGHCNAWHDCRSCILLTAAAAAGVQLRFTLIVTSTINFHLFWFRITLSSHLLPLVEGSYWLDWSGWCWVLHFVGSSCNLGCNILWRVHLLVIGRGRLLKETHTILGQSVDFIYHQKSYVVLKPLANLCHTCWNWNHDGLKSL
jgi:hypothetical protein